jgi:L-ribulose-5-phosphate 3-epimerase
LLAAIRQVGFEYVEMSIDESDERMSRLSWGPRQRAEVRDAVAETGVPVISMCLSAHRKYPMGSASPAIRQKGMDLLFRTIELAADLGVRIVLVPGYDVFYEPSTPDSRERFMDSLRPAIVWASCAGVMLAMENTDLNITSVREALTYVGAMNSPWLQLYLDIGNLVAAGEDLFCEIEAAVGHVVGVHVKDALPGQFRSVPLGEGNVPIVAALQTLWRTGFTGPIMLEMWETGDQIDYVALNQARQWIAARIEESRIALSHEARTA